MTWLVRLALAAIRSVSWLVPRRDREEFRREWQGEIVHEHLSRRAGLSAGMNKDVSEDWRSDVSLLRRSLGSIADAAWLRRQFTRDSEVFHDMRHALRIYRRTPGMLALVAGVLAIGIGAPTAVFSAVDALLLQPIPFADPGRAVMLWQRTPELPQGEMAPADFLDLKERVHQFDIVAAAEPFSRDYTDAGEPEIFAGARVTTGFFDVLRVTPLQGRLFNDEDYRERRQVVLLSEALWRRRFGAASDAVGRIIRLDGEPFEVVGILPAAFEPRLLGGALDVWTAKTSIEDYERRSRGSGYWHVVAAMRSGVTPAQAQEDLDAVSGQLAAQYPKTNGNLRTWAMPLRTHLANGAERPLTLLAIGAGLILLLALGSVANLQMTLLTGRLQEFVVRLALGAQRRRLIRQVLAETMVLASVAVAAGIALAAGLLAGIRAVAPDTLALPQQGGLRLGVLLFAAGLGLLVALVAVILPMLAMLRPDVVPQAGALSTRSAVSISAGRSTLAVVQIALAAVLLVSAGLLARSFMRVLATDPGLATRQLLALQVFAYDRNDTAAKRSAFFGETLDRIRALPGVDSAGAASTVPFLKADIDILAEMTIVGSPPVTSGEERRVYLTTATPEYFSTAGIPLRRGRVFTTSDVIGHAGVALLNDTAARRYWPKADPIGQSIELGDEGRTKTVQIVGVVGDLRYGGLEGAPRPEVFLPHAQSPSAAMTYVVRTSLEPSALLPAIKKAVWSVDPLQTFYDAGSVPDMVRHSLRARIFALRLVLALAAIGLVLAVAGAYGAIAWALRQRTAEFGVRLALGARAIDIQRHILSYAMRLAAVGIAAGLLVSLFLGTMLRTFLFGIDAHDPLTLFGIASLLFLAVLAACMIPARRAAGIDPISALRADA